MKNKFILFLIIGLLLINGCIGKSCENEIVDYLISEEFDTMLDEIGNVGCRRGCETTFIYLYDDYLTDTKYSKEYIDCEKICD